VNGEDARPVALVTGASSGFGMLASVELARRGHRVIATMRDPSKRERLDAAAREAGVEVELARLDVTDEASIRAAVAEAGAIDVLVNNAGFGMGGFVEDLSMAELREQFETNFFGLVAVTKAVIPGMRERRRGKVINVSSISGRFAAPGVAAYASSKWAVEGFSESLRAELLPYDVYVSLVEPGTFKTEIFERNRRVAVATYEESSPYYERSRQLERIVDRILAKNRQDPRLVARVIADIAEAKAPRLRWLVGRDAKGQAFAKWLAPSKLLERAVQRYMERMGRVRRG
jgi:NAD(P)-dependent dehydrogenase (short-subunit alcohol dehydrogenase family)